MPKFSVVVLNWNGKHFLDDCLSFLQRQTFRDFEVIFVDNGSSDDSVSYVQEYFPNVNVVALEKNLGFTGGNIEGLKHCVGDFVVLLNNDTEVSPTWLAELHEATQIFPSAGAFASKMLYFSDRTRIDNCGFLLAPGGFTVDYGRDLFDGPEFNQYRWVFGACGGAATYRRSALDKAGFLDPDFFMTYEDLDLSFRLQLQGYGCVFVPGAIVYHKYRSTMKNFPARQVFYSQRNIEYVWVKNMPWRLLLTGAPARVLYAFGSFLFFSCDGACLPFLRAKFSALRAVPALLRKRWIIQRSRTASAEQIQAMMTRNSIREKLHKLLSAYTAKRELTV